MADVTTLDWYGFEQAVPAEVEEALGDGLLPYLHQNYERMIAAQGLTRRTALVVNSDPAWEVETDEGVTWTTLPIFDREPDGKLWRLAAQVS